MSDPFLGQIQPMGFDFAPAGWAKCDGQLLSIASNQALFALLGTTYGGNGQTTFELPDLRGRTPLHEGTGPGLSPRPIGSIGGEDTHQLSINEMPSHSHVMTVRATGQPSGSDMPENNHLASGDFYSSAPPDIAMGAAAIQVQTSGGGAAFNQMPPFIAVNWCIALVGIFPSQ